MKGPQPCAIGRFVKMHGLGNDFVVIDARETPVILDAARARALADRRTGIGCDQLILIEPSSRADVVLRFFNADGSESGACGNGTRAAAALIGRALTIETRSGLLRASPESAHTTVTLPPPRSAWDAIPLAYPLDTQALPLSWDELANPMALNVGNPHLVFVVEDVDAIDLAQLGPRIENDPLFPERINVNIVSITGPDCVRLRTWERGAGLTQACGTGACATSVAVLKQGLVQGPVTVAMPGGALVIQWDPKLKQAPIQMTGPVARPFEGWFDWADFPLDPKAPGPQPTP